MIITIARQCGSGGHEIGKELASRLGLELYDRKRLEEEARKIGKFDENKDFFREKAVNSLLYSIAVSDGEANPMEKSFLRLFSFQKSALTFPDFCSSRSLLPNSQVLTAKSKIS